MTLIDLLKVMDGDSPIRLNHGLVELFAGDVDGAMEVLTCDHLEMTITNIWVSLNLFKAIVIELE